MSAVYIGAQAFPCVRSEVDARCVFLLWLSMFFLLQFYVLVFCLHMSVYHVHELQLSVNMWVLGIEPRVRCKCSQYSQPLSHLSGPRVIS